MSSTFSNPLGSSLQVLLLQQPRQLRRARQGQPAPHRSAGPQPARHDGATDLHDRGLHSRGAENFRNGGKKEEQQFKKEGLLKT